MRATTSSAAMSTRNTPRMRRARMPGAETPWARAAMRQRYAPPRRRARLAASGAERRRPLSPAAAGSGRGTAACAPRVGLREDLPRRTALDHDAAVHEQHLVGRPAARTPSSWVTTTIVQPSSASSLITVSTSPTSSGSSARVGSSNSSSCGLQRERAHDADALLLPAGQLERVGVALLGEPDPVEQRSASATASALRRRCCTRTGPSMTFSQHRHVREQVVVLEDHRRAVAQRVDRRASPSGAREVERRVRRRTRSCRRRASRGRSGERSTVVLPEPRGPMSTTTSPRRTSRSIELQHLVVAEGLAQAGAVSSAVVRAGRRGRACGGCVSGRHSGPASSRAALPARRARGRSPSRSAPPRGTAA